MQRRQDSYSVHYTSTFAETMAVAWRWLASHTCTRFFVRVSKLYSHTFTNLTSSLAFISDEHIPCTIDWSSCWCKSKGRVVVWNKETKNLIANPNEDFAFSIKCVLTFSIYPSRSALVLLYTLFFYFVFIWDWFELLLGCYFSFSRMSLGQPFVSFAAMVSWWS